MSLVECTIKLLEEGVSDIPTIEAAARSTFAIGMGPFELMNVTGIPIAHHALAAMEREMGEFYRPARLLGEQVEKKILWDLSGTAQTGALVEAVSRRLLGVVFGLACQIVDEEVCGREDVDRGAIVGLRWTEGPFELMNKLSILTSQDFVESVAAKYTSFPVQASLRNQAAQGKPWKLTTVDLTVMQGVATITLNRPKPSTPLTNPMKFLDEAVTRANDDPSVKPLSGRRRQGLRGGGRYPLLR